MEKKNGLSCHSFRKYLVPKQLQCSVCQMGETVCSCWWGRRKEKPRSRNSKHKQLILNDSQELESKEIFGGSSQSTLPESNRTSCCFRICFISALTSTVRSQIGCFCVFLLLFFSSSFFSKQQRKQISAHSAGTPVPLQRWVPAFLPAG